MPWPQSQDYNEAVQSPATNFVDPDLQRGAAATNALGIPLPHSGNFADVYELRGPEGARWAVKCFTRETMRLRERYTEISGHLRRARLPFMIDFDYLEQGIRVAGRWFPVLKMQWVEGLTLNQFVARAADKPTVLESLLRIWARMSQHLRGSGMSHCDLQHGNVLLVFEAGSKAPVLKLVDYDGLFVPALASNPSGEVGHGSYQHPRRLHEGTYSLELDRFPVLLVATALRALKVGGRALWDRYDNGDNLLFTQKDLEAPNKSRLFYELLKVDEPGVRLLVHELIEAARQPLEQTPLLEDVLPELRAASAQTLVARRTVPVAMPRGATMPPLENALAFEESSTPAVAVWQPEQARQQRTRTSVGIWVAATVALLGLLIFFAGIAVAVSSAMR